MKPATIAHSPDPHAFTGEHATAPRKATKSHNQPIPCCQCGVSFIKETWEQTVASFEKHEQPCLDAYTASRLARAQCA